MRGVYFHLVGGASGDMLLSSLLDLGCPFSYLQKEFRKLKLDFKITLQHIRVGHFSHKKLFFKSKLNLTFKEVLGVINKSGLDKDIKEKAIKAYRDIFEIEKKIHKIKGNDLKFHHLGEIDAILEICGFFLSLRYLKIDNIYVSSFPLGLAALATLEILRGKKINAVNLGYETVTPTAAILLKEAEQIDSCFNFKAFGISYGDCGERDYLIAYLFDAEEKAGLDRDRIIKIETNIDDMNPQIFEPLFAKLYKNGAKEVYLEQVMMKKTRPAFVLNVLCLPDDFSKIREIIFSHTSTFGIRYQEYLRDKLKYKFTYKNTKFGKIKFRVSEPPFPKERPEYQDCLKAANKFNLPLLEVYRQING